MGKGTGQSKPGTIEFVLLPPVATIGLSSDEDVQALVKQIHSTIARELRVPESKLELMSFTLWLWLGRRGLHFLIRELITIDFDYLHISACRRKVGIADLHTNM